MGAHQGVHTSWVDVASRAHMLLSQTMPDELLDELVAPHTRPTTPPVFLLRLAG